MIVPWNAHGRRVPGPEATEEERELLAGNFVDDNFLRVLGVPILFCAICSPDPDQPHSNCKQTLDEDQWVHSERPMEINAHLSPCQCAEEHEPERGNRQDDAA